MLNFIYAVEMKVKRSRKLHSAVYIAGSYLINAVYPAYLKIWMKFSKKRLDYKRGMIVSLTSFPARIHTTKVCVETIMKQTVRPEKIILWLAKEQFPDQKEVEAGFKEFILKGLEIRYCDDLRSHKKYYYTMQEYPNAVVVTLDDDVFYPSYTLEYLLQEHQRNPECIIANEAKVIWRDPEGNILPYNEWKSAREEWGEKTQAVCQIGVGGVLYPPHSLRKEVFNKDDIQNLAFHTDDLWLNAMARLKGTRIVCTKQFPTLFCIGNSQKKNLGAVNCGMNRNDIEMGLILKKYPDAFKKGENHL